MSSIKLETRKSISNISHGAFQWNTWWQVVGVGHNFFRGRIIFYLFLSGTNIENRFGEMLSCWKISLFVFVFFWRRRTQMVHVNFMDALMHA